MFRGVLTDCVVRQWCVTCRVATTVKWATAIFSAFVLPRQNLKSHQQQRAHVERAASVGAGPDEDVIDDECVAATRVVLAATAAATFLPKFCRDSARPRVGKPQVFV